MSDIVYRLHQLAFHFGKDYCGFANDAQAAIDEIVSLRIRADALSATSACLLTVLDRTVTQNGEGAVTPDIAEMISARMDDVRAALAQHGGKP